MSNNQPCPIWGTPAIAECGGGAYFRRVESPRAGGKYEIFEDIAHAMRQHEDGLKIRLTSWLIEQRRLGNPRPQINPDTISAAKQWRDESAVRRADSILEYLADRSNTLGQEVALQTLPESTTKVSVDDFERTYLELLAHSGCMSSDELVFLLKHLRDRQFIEYRAGLSGMLTCALTVKGYTRLAELEQTSTMSSTGFVAMWFDSSMEKVWEHGLEPGIRNAGYDPVRIDRQEHLNKIDDEIIAEIRRSRFVVADFTHGTQGARGGVYYEAGFAHGRGIPVIFTCREDQLCKVHFDTRQYKHLLWTEPADLRDKLANRIMATLGDGPHKQSH